MMRLLVLLPTEVLVDEPVAKVVAEAENGCFGMLPRHVDFAAALVPGLLAFTDARGGERLVAIDEGILVKCGPDVRVSTRNAVSGDSAAQLRETMRSRFRALDDEAQGARSALARLEAGALRRFLELEEHVDGR
jgi:F-type H+-transporting ATPase subunit epsilon